MNLQPLRSNEPTTPAWLAISRMLDENFSVDASLRAELLANYLFSAPGFCTASVQAFTALHKNEFNPKDLSRGLSFRTFIQHLPLADHQRLGLLVGRAPQYRKASKAGQALAEIARLGGSFGPETSACALDAMALAFSHFIYPPFPAEPRARLIELVTRRARDAWPPLLASALCRACHESDEAVLTEILDCLGPNAQCFGIAPLGSTPLGLSVQRACMNARGGPRPFACVELLLARGADPDGRDAGGLTPLTHAARSNSLEGCSLLLAAGANPWVLARTQSDHSTEWTQLIPDHSSCVEFMAIMPATRALSLSLAESRSLGGDLPAPPRAPGPRI